MFYFLNCTIQQDKNPLNTSNNTVVHTVWRDEKNTLFLTAGRSKKHFKKLYQQLHNSSKRLGCNGYKLSSHIDAKKKPNRKDKKKLSEE